MSASRNRFGALGRRLAKLEATAANQMQRSNQSKDALWDVLVDLAERCEASGNVNPEPSDSGAILAAKALARFETATCAEILKSNVRRQ